MTQNMANCKCSCHRLVKISLIILNSSAIVGLVFLLFIRRTIELPFIVFVLGAGLLSIYSLINKIKKFSFQILLNQKKFFINNYLITDWFKI